MTSFLNIAFLLIIFLIALENVFPPIPSEVILTLGGFMTSYTKMSVFGVIIASTIGSLIGAIILYYIGLKFSKTKLKKISSKVFYSQDDISNTSSFFRKHGYMTVFYCRFVPVLRSVISIPAGANKMNIKPFILFTLIGSAIWNTVLVVLGRIFGKNYEYIVSTDSDLYGYSENGYASYPLTMFSELGTIGAHYHSESNYYSDSVLENFTVIVDFANTNIETTYNNVSLFMELTCNEYVRPTINSSKKRFNIVNQESGQTNINLENITEPIEFGAGNEYDIGFTGELINNNYNDYNEFISQFKTSYLLNSLFN